MREGWKLISIGELCKTGSGGTPLKSKKEYYEDGRVPWLQSGEVAQGEITESKKFITELGLKNSSAKIFPPNTVLVAMYGATAGAVGKLRVSAATNQAVCGIYPNEKLSSEFLYYALLEKQKELIATASGNAQPNISQIKVKGTTILLPPLAEQKRIVAVLDEAFEGIDQALAAATKNLKNARELFETTLNATFTQKGEGLSVRKLGDESLLKIIDGDRGANYPKKADFSDEGFCLFLNTKNVRLDGFSFNETMFISEGKDHALRKGKLERRDVLLTTRGTIGNIALYDSSVPFDNIRINSGMLIFRPNEDEILADYLFELFRSSFFKSQVSTFVSGAAQPQLPIKTLVNFDLPVPKSLEVQKEIVKMLRAIWEQTQSLEALYQKKIEALSELKQSLLQKAFAGELTAESQPLEATG